MVVEEKGLRLPTYTDFIGAAAALIRLQRTYTITTDDMAKGDVGIVLQAVI